MLRRQFLRTAGTVAAGLALPGSLLLAAPPRRIRGQVRRGGRALGNVGMTDGFTTVVTDRDGRYTLLAHPRAKFVSVRLPAGFRVATPPNRTARHHQPLPADGRGGAPAG